MVRGLWVATQNDVALPPDVLPRGLDWLESHQKEQLRRMSLQRGQRNFKSRADNVNALVHRVLCEAGRQNAEMLNRLFQDRNDLSLYGKVLLGLSLEKSQAAEQLTMVLRNLRQYLVEDSENQTAYLRMPADGYWWFWFGDEIETDAAYLTLLSRTEPAGPVAPALVKYLLNNRKHATYWKSTRDTALCVEAFAEYLQATKELQPEMTVSIFIDGKKHHEQTITRDNLFSFNDTLELRGAELPEGEHEIEVRRDGRGPVYLNAYLTNFTLEDPITSAGLEIQVQRKIYRLDRVAAEKKSVGQTGQALSERVEKYRRVLLKSGDQIDSGDLVEVELEIEAKNDYEYIMFSDKKAAGFEPVEVRSGYGDDGLGAYMELRDEEVTFFLKTLARGKHSVAYRLRAEIPGDFAALPAVCEAMYAPELKGNSDEIRLRIAD